MENDVREMEERRLAAMAANDVATLTPMLADQLLYLHSSGDRDGKAKYLDQIENGTIVYRRVTPRIQEVHTLGSTAVVFGRLDAEVTRAGSELTLDYDYLAVWTEISGHWQLFAYQPRP